MSSAPPSFRALPTYLLVLLLAQAAWGQQGFYTGRQTIALGGDAYSVTLSADELYLIFASKRTGSAGGYDLWETRRSGIGAAWTTPVNLAVLNTTDDEYEPALSFNGAELYFVRRQPTITASAILRSTRTMTGGWSAPAPAPGLPSPNTVPLDDPYLTSDALKMYYTETAVNNGDIFIVTRTSQTGSWGGRTPFTIANGAGVDRAPMPDGDGGVVFFSRSTTSAAQSDLYVTWRDATGPYATPMPVADVNTSLADRNGHLGATTGRLYLSVDPFGAAHLDEHCPVPVSCATGSPYATLGRTLPGTTPPSPFFAKSFVYKTAIGSVTTVGWRDWRVPPPPPEVFSLLYLSALVNPPNVQLTGFRGAFNLDLGFFPLYGVFPVLPDGRVLTPIAVPNNASLLGVSVQFQNIRIVPSNGTGVFSHLLQFNM